MKRLTASSAIRARIESLQAPYRQALNGCVMGLPHSSAFPYIVDARFVPMFQDVISASHKVLKKFAQLSTSDDFFSGLLPDLGISGCASGHEVQNFDVFRIDTFFDPNTGSLKVLEFNTGDPSGFGCSDLMGDILGPLWAKEIPELELWRTRTVDQIIALLKSDRGAALSSKSVIAIVAPLNSSVNFDHRAIQSLLSPAFAKALHLNPADIQLDGNVVRSLDGTVIDFIFRDAWDEIAENESYKTFKRVLLENAAPHLSTLESNIGDEKYLFSLLSDSRICAKYFGDLASPLGRYLLPTWSLDSSCVESAIRDREKLVLKPSYGYGGFDVSVGRTLSKESWGDRLSAAIQSKKSYILQQYCEPSTADFLDQDGRIEEGLNTTLSLWGVGGSFAGAFVRASTSPVVNVHQGGNLTPVFFANEI